MNALGWIGIALAAFAVGCVVGWAVGVFSGRAVTIEEFARKGFLK